ncbi:hypothetical protein ACE41O_12040 [Alteromonas macleodii]|uniref:hypothetical protein n=2 Tax=Alteromonas TaxID=226 RepID=UPI0031400076
MPHMSAPVIEKLYAREVMNDDKIAELKLQRAVEHFKSVIQMAELALKSSIMINGGAAVALLTFVGNSKAEDKTFLVYSLFAFSLGVLFGAISALLAYLAQNHFMEQINNNESPSDNQAHKISAIGAISLSYLAFFIGILLASQGVSN